MSELKKPPIKHKFGNVSVNQWENEGTNGLYPTFSIECSYKPDGEDKWIQKTSFTRDELCKLQVAVQKALTSL